MQMEGTCGYRRGELQAELRYQQRGDWCSGTVHSCIISHSRIRRSVRCSPLEAGALRWLDLAALRTFLRGQCLRQSTQGLWGSWM